MTDRLQKTVRVGRVLTLGGPRARITARANHHDAVERQLRQRLGPPLCNHVALGALEPSRLVLVTDSPVWSNRIRYQAQRLLTSLSDFFDSQAKPRLEIKIVPDLGKLPSRDRTRAPISARSARHLEQFAKTGNLDARQASALRRIAASRSAGTGAGVPGGGFEPPDQDGDS